MTDEKRRGERERERELIREIIFYKNYSTINSTEYATASGAKKDYVGQTDSTREFFNSRSETVIHPPYEKISQPISNYRRLDSSSLDCFQHPTQSVRMPRAKVSARSPYHATLHVLGLFFPHLLLPCISQNEVKRAR